MLNLKTSILLESLFLSGVELCDNWSENLSAAAHVG